MRSKFLAFTILAAFGTLVVRTLAAVQLSSPSPEVATKIVSEDRYPAHDVLFPNGVRGIPDVVYRVSAGYRPLTLDLYLPPHSVVRPENGFPLIVYIHGGAWLSGDARRTGPFADFPSVLASLSAKGYVVASIEYRLSREAIFPAQIEDVKSAIRWLRSRAPEYGINPSRTMTWGVSAGAHLAALAAVKCDAAAVEPQTTRSGSHEAKTDIPNLPNTSECVQGSVAWYGVFDMTTMAAQARRDKTMSRDVSDAPEWKLLGCFASECKADQLAAASPVTYVDATDPPMLLIVGKEDKTVPYDQTLEMANKLKAARVPYDLIVLPGIDHSFVGKTLEKTRDANLKALAATFRFFDQNIGDASHTN